MEILGVGPMELFFILIIALIVLGPNDMVKAGKTVGRTLRKIVMSPTWMAVQQTSRELRHLPNRLMREAGLEEEIKDLKQTQEMLKLQMDEVRKIQAPLRETTEQINQEAQTIGSGLGAWITPPAEPASPAASPAPASSEPPAAYETNQNNETVLPNES